MVIQNKSFENYVAKSRCSISYQRTRKESLMGRGVKFARYFFLFNNLKKVNKDYMSHDDMTPLSRG